MKGLDGIQGPVYVGTGCVFRRQALYGYAPPKGPKRPKMVSCDCCPCFGRRRKLDKQSKDGVNGDSANVQGLFQCSTSQPSFDVRLSCNLVIAQLHKGLYLFCNRI